MVDKRSLRSSKKDTQETPAEQQQDQKQPKPTRTRSGRSRKVTTNKTQDTETTPAAEEGQQQDSAAAAASTSAAPQSEDIVMETESVATAPEKGSEDIEMKNADEHQSKTEEKKEDTTPSPLTSTPTFIVRTSLTILVIKQNLQLLDRAVNTLDPRFTYRVLKMSNLRKRLSAEVLVQAIREVYPADHPSVSQLLSLLDKVLNDLISG